MKIRRRGKSLAVCLLMLMTFLYLCNPLGVNAEEKLFKANDWVFQNNTYNFDPELGASAFSGESSSKTAYKYVSEYNGTYHYYNDCRTFTTNKLDEALKGAEVVSEGGYVYIPTNLSNEETTEAFQSKLKEYKTYVYTEADELKYTITHDKMSAYASNTSISHEVAISKGSAITDANGVTVGFNYSISNNNVTSMTLDNGTSSYDVVVANNQFQFTGSDGTYDYQITLSDEFVVTGQLVQSGVSNSASTSDIGEYDMGTDTIAPNPTITLSKIPTKKCESFTLTIKTDIDSIIWFNGASNDKYTKSQEFEVTENGTFYYSASTADGGYAEGSVEVKCIKKDDSADDTAWSDNDWSGSSSSKGSSNNLVQTGLFDNGINFTRYIGAVLVLLGATIIVAKKRGFSFKRGGKKA